MYDNFYFQILVTSSLFLFNVLMLCGIVFSIISIFGLRKISNRSSDAINSFHGIALGIQDLGDQLVGSINNRFKSNFQSNFSGNFDTKKANTSKNQDNNFDPNNSFSNKSNFSSNFGDTQSSNNSNNYNDIFGSILGATLASFTSKAFKKKKTWRDYLDDIIG